MKVVICIAVAFGLSSLVVSGKVGEAEDESATGATIVVSADMIDEMLREMPISEMDYYSDRFYPEVIKAMNRKLYSRKARAKNVLTEKRIRNIKLNAFVKIPNNRDGTTINSSFAYLSKNESTSFVVYKVKNGKQLIDIRSPDVACIFGMSEEHTAVKAKACREDVPNMTWELIPNKYGDFWVRQQGTKLCLSPVLTMGQPRLLQLLTCNRYDPYLIWEIQDSYIYYKK